MESKEKLRDYSANHLEVDKSSSNGSSMLGSQSSLSKGCDSKWRYCAFGNTRYSKPTNNWVMLTRRKGYDAL
jgi:hypothetical protein